MAQHTYDLVIRSGKVMDGSGNPWFRADIGIRKGKIVRVGSIPAREARASINADGRLVTPGFIDIHTHCDSKISERPLVENYAHQGVSTVIGGNCGFHGFPIRSSFRDLKKKGISLNFGCLAGHNTLRKKVMGLERRAPKRSELAAMKKLLQREMEDGALGLSSGLIYMPGVYSETDELVALAKIVAPFGGMYATHMRFEGKKVTSAIEEALAIGRANNIRVQISHSKLVGQASWGQIRRIFRPVERARSEGMEVGLDQYPYIATHTGLSTLFPSWAKEGGNEQMLARMSAERSFHERVKKEVVGKRLNPAKGGRKLSSIQVSSYSAGRRFEGKNLTQILRMQGKRATGVNAFELLKEMMKAETASGVFFSMCEADVERIMQSPLVMVGSDSGVQQKGKGVPHPRSYGTFPRVLGRYVREKKAIPLELAIRKMTSLPAQALRLPDRGLIKQKMWADLTIFDPDKVMDRATFDKPHQYPVGIDYLIVNGEVVIRKGKHTRKRPGKVLKHF